MVNIKNNAKSYLGNRSILKVLDCPGQLAQSSLLNGNPKHTSMVFMVKVVFSNSST